MVWDTARRDDEPDHQTDGRDDIFVCPRVGQQDVDIKLSGHFIKEIHCVFVSETNEQGEGEMFKLLLNAILLLLIIILIQSGMVITETLSQPYLHALCNL